MPDAPLRVGDTLTGFCGGWFGRDSFDAKRVEAVGADWVVARDTLGMPLFVHCTNPDALTVHRR